MTLDEALAAMPVVAILAGVTPDEVIGVAERWSNTGSPSSRCR
jgi:hypothetical protein